MCKIKNKKVGILMATYNGQKYIKEQIDSILNQTYFDFDLIIRDDNSNDDTLRIIRSYTDERITVIQNDSCKHGSLANFSALFNYAKGKYEYLFFSDQDDVWKKDKIVKSLDLMDDSIPMVLYGNFNLWYYESNKYIQMYNKMKKNLTFENVLIQNPMYGCTMCLNDKFVRLVDTIPENCENHDYWFSLVALYNDDKCKVKYINDILLDHRLHADNVTGNKKSRTIKGRLSNLKRGPLNQVDRRKKQLFWRAMGNQLLAKYGFNIHYNNMDYLNKHRGLVNIFGLVKRGFCGLSNKATLYFLLMNR